MERIFEAKRCLAENRLAYSEYLLAGEASLVVQYENDVRRQ